MDERIVCPYCNADYEDDMYSMGDHYIEDIYDGNRIEQWTIDCPLCENKFYYVIKYKRVSIENLKNQML